MSDVNKIVAAILTAGRVPTMDVPGAPRTMADWMAEYDAWLQTLAARDAADKEAASQANMNDFAALGR